MKPQTRYIAKCKACKTAMSTLADDDLNPRDADRGLLVEGKGYGVAFGDYGLPCSTCGKLRTAKRVRGRFNSRIECNAKCQAATGHNCECSCAGKNHGAAWG